MALRADTPDHWCKARPCAAASQSAGVAAIPNGAKRSWRRAVLRQHNRDVAEALIFGNPAGCRPTRPQVKNGAPGTHPLTGRELRELRQHQRENLKSPFMFVSERGATGFSRKDRVDTLQAYLGHRNIKNTTCYTALAPDRFKGFWRD